MTEWQLAVVTFLWGLMLLHPASTFDQPDFSGFKEIFKSETLLGAGMVFLGVLRIGGLIVNGARQNVTPHIRVLSAGVGCMIFAGITWFYMLSEIWSPWLAVYPVFVVSEFINVFRAAHDVGESRNGQTT
jgi:hypothetical protein